MVTSAFRRLVGLPHPVSEIRMLVDNDVTSAFRRLVGLPQDCFGWEHSVFAPLSPVPFGV